MPDEQTDKMVRLLEEIRDLTKQHHAKLEAYYDDALRRQKEAQERALLQRRRFLFTLTPLLLLAIGFIAYLAFWVIPHSEQSQWERQMHETLMMQSNYLSQPH